MGAAALQTLLIGSIEAVSLTNFSFAPVWLLR
jgi:hypothetical protein